MQPLKDLFLLDPDVVFLNHGSYGACPRPVFQAYQDWQARLERQPVLFLGRELDGHLRQSREKLGAFLGARAEDLVYILNATYGVNIIARSLAFQPGDEILTTDHEYGACNYTWEFVCRKSGIKYLHQPVSLAMGSPENIIEQFWQGVTPRTKAIYLSHITSPTAFCFPVGEICRRARQAGIITIVDGAHAPGQIPLDLLSMDVDFYFGNLHKWTMAPKGAAFLYVRHELQHLIEPLVVSWGYHAAPESTTGSQLIDYLQWTGTKDPAAALALPDALQFMEKYNWDEVRKACHALLRQAIERIGDLTGLAPLYPMRSDSYVQMGSVPLPKTHDLTALKARLYDEYGIEVPLMEWNGRHLIRVSVQGYNTQQDIDALVGALRNLLPSG
jgi:isopenicillin-N epimerase